MEYQVSVVVLLYNSSWERIRATINSVIKQKKVKFQLILADDGSKYNYKKEIESLLKMENFSDYLLIINDKNVGTVKNLLNAVKYADSKFIKPIGQGDLFFSEESLYSYLMYISNTDYAVFGSECVPYYYDDGEFVIPNRYPSMPQRKYKYEKIGISKSNYCKYPDRLNGASLIYNKDVLLHYLMTYADKVFLCEDLLVELMLLDNCKIGYKKEYLMYYEIGSGVSSASDVSPIVLRDEDYINSFVKEKYPNYSKINLRKGKSKCYYCFVLLLHPLYLNHLIKQKLLPILCRIKADLKFLCECYS